MVQKTQMLLLLAALLIAIWIVTEYLDVVGRPTTSDDAVTLPSDWRDGAIVEIEGPEGIRRFELLELRELTGDEYQALVTRCRDAGLVLQTTTDNRQLTFNDCGPLVPRAPRGQ